uniref:INO80 complex subunit C n=1 Tax=Calidris pygmaea TaxID=425635 RepID=A0A8C3J4T1_9CHAR
MPARSRRPRRHCACAGTASRPLWGKGESGRSPGSAPPTRPGREFGRRGVGEAVRARGEMASLTPAAASSPAGAPSRSKKRPASPGTGGGPAKKKKATAAGGSQSAGGEAMNENKFLNTDSSTGSVETTVKPLPFKDPNFIHSGIGGAAAGKKNRTWKNLKQILASERALPWQLNDPSYFNIDAPPSFKPAKKYSDISGLPANYTDPQSKLRFSTIEEFAYIRMLPSDVVTGYLALRKATSIVS